MHRVDVVFFLPQGHQLQLEMLGETNNKMLQLLLQRIMNGIECGAAAMGTMGGQPRINGELVLPPSDAMGDGTVVKD